MFAAGNGKPDGDNCACDGYVSSIYTVVVAGCDESGHVTHYSERCAAILTTAYSGAGFEKNIVCIHFLNRLIPNNNNSNKNRNKICFNFWRSRKKNLHLCFIPLFKCSIGLIIERRVFDEYRRNTYFRFVCLCVLQVTTDVNGKCTEKHTGTSAAAPLVSGIIALGLSAK